MSQSDPIGVPADDVDVNRPSQAEGEDPERDQVDEVVVLEQAGRPSQAEGEDPEHEDHHEVLEP